MDLDPFAPEWRENPWPVFHALQDEPGIHRYESGGFLATRHATCEAILRDRRFGSDPTRLSTQGRAAIGRNDMYQPTVLIFTDPPDHTRLRGLVAKAFTPGTIATLRPAVGDLANRYVDAVIERGEMEVIGDLAYPLPAEVICHMLGVPEDDRPPFRDWSADASRLLDGELPPEEMERCLAGSVALFDYFQQLVDDRRKHPGTDLLSDLIAAEEAGDRLSADELLTTLVMLFVAGHETTMNLIGNAVVALIDHPDQLASVTAARLRPAVEEALRYEGPAMVVPRVVLEDAVVEGTRLEAGDSLVVALAAANRDPRRFVDPDRYLIDRPDAGHLAFSLGPHHCLGAALARLEAEEVLRALITRLRDLQFVGPRPHHRRHAILRGMEEVRIGFSPVAA